MRVRKPRSVTVSWHEVDQWWLLVEMRGVLLLILMQKAASMVRESKALVNDL